jgi:hypothetical protein
MEADSLAARPRADRYRFVRIGAIGKGIKGNEARGGRIDRDGISFLDTRNNKRKGTVADPAMGWDKKWKTLRELVYKGHVTETQPTASAYKPAHAHVRIYNMLLPDNVFPPLRLEHKEFVLRPLQISDVVKDYDAVMSSIDHLQGVFGSRSKWPSPDLSFEQDLIDLGWHHKEFQRRTSFAYTVMKPDESQCLGCVYIYPSKRDGYDAEAYCWVRKSAAELDKILYDIFKQWIEEKWPFKSVAYPGR